MNLVEYFLEKRKKCIICISGFLWWDYFDIVVNFLAKNLDFEIIYTYPLIPGPDLISAATEINFPALNETVKERLNKYTKKGYIIVSYTFPSEYLEFYPDIHINLNVNPSLLTNITIDYIKKTKISRIKVDTHISYLLSSWKTNKITNKILYDDKYRDKEDILYGYIFDAVMHYMKVKIYGEKYTESTRSRNINSAVEILDTLDNKKIIEEEEETVKDTNILTIYDTSKT